MKKIILCLTIISLLTISCQEPIFKHEESREIKPWRHLNFDDAPDKFSFAVFSDLTGGERPEIFKVAVEQLNLLRPEFIVNVGDLIEGANEDPSEWHQQWDDFDQRASKAIAPIFYAGGNHDLTGEMARSVWSKRLGSRYYHFRYKDVLFLIFDTEDNTPERMKEIEHMRTEAIANLKTDGWDGFNKSDYANIPERTAGTVGSEQTNYFLKVIADNADARWTFVLIHKPAWEKENEQNFSKIEEALSAMPYTVFNGHTHLYNHQQRHGRDYINLATTGGHQFPEQGHSFDHFMWVTVDNDGVTLANLKMEGILDKTAHIPLGGDTLVFENK
ncbi:metallophosphoesterase [Carboxylicivirga sp. M1479]|uniref:metallophosphoesterase family protein n=1 Tax=Carboxylicivirga sp. M1479 TaxID=2594476 RepID=UPI0011779ACC|nr:metallophosphoesterase family protein [Carboxylicivirga sp. M1479]TRX63319.1 serine/threonine protein phosphatase [Carboxylicivirga sp. M1479]